MNPKSQKIGKLNYTDLNVEVMFQKKLWKINLSE